MSDEALQYEVRGKAAWLTICREDRRNAISPGVIDLFFKGMDRAEADPAVRVVVITGAGDRVFCSGADLAGQGGSGQDVFAAYAGLLKRIYAFSKPTVARVNGHCLAGGTGFMLACDIVVARQSAMFGTPEVNVGLFPMMIGALIFRNVPRKKAMEMVLLGEKLTAVQALEMGMITRVTADDALDGEVEKVVTQLGEKSPIGMALGKQAFCAAEEMNLGDALDYLSAKLGEVMATGDAAEGIAAFLEKRKPVFQGR
ncbi:MAG: enoyl-CoA hydratase-related protein [Thermodesulfobacteriota bacterium]|nr:enoyl-CoA hydratase-related protein [Thermodesulfobacteriota bacterium]